jgi:NLR family CARD domain-containing protein 3
MTLTVQSMSQTVHNASIAVNPLKKEQIISSLTHLQKDGIRLVERIVRNQPLQLDPLTPIVTSLDSMVASSLIRDNLDIQRVLSKTYRLFLELLWHQKEESLVVDATKEAIFKHTDEACSYFNEQSAHDITFEYTGARAVAKLFHSEVPLWKKFLPAIKGVTPAAGAETILAMKDFFGKNAPEVWHMDLHPIRFKSLCAKTKNEWEQMIPGEYRGEGRTITSQILDAFVLNSSEEQRAIHLALMCQDLLETPEGRDRELLQLAIDKLHIVKGWSSTADKASLIAKAYFSRHGYGIPEIPVEVVLITPKEREIRKIIGELERLQLMGESELLGFMGDPQCDSPFVDQKPPRALELLEEVVLKMDRLFHHAPGRLESLLPNLIDSTPTRVDQHLSIAHSLAKSFRSIGDKEGDDIHKIRMYQRALTYHTQAQAIAGRIGSPLRLEDTFSRIVSFLIEKNLIASGVLCRQFKQAVEQGDSNFANKILDQVERLHRFCNGSEKDIVERMDKEGNLQKLDEKDILEWLYDQLADALTPLPPSFVSHSKRIASQREQIKNIREGVPCIASSEYRDLLQHFRDSFATRESQKLATRKYKDLLQTVLRDTTDLMGPIPSCRYSMRLLNAISREEITPFSPLEMFVFVESQEPEKTKAYFERFMEVFKLLLMTLGESPATFSIAPPTLGVHLNGCEVITPITMGERELNLLRRTSTAIQSFPGDLDWFPNLCKNVVDPTRDQKGLSNLLQKYVEERPATSSPDSLLTKESLKRHYTAPLIHLLSDLRIYLGIEATSTEEVIEEMLYKGFLHQDSCTLLKQGLLTLISLRIKTALSESVSLTDKERRELHRIQTLILDPLYACLEPILQAFSSEPPLEPPLAWHERLLSFFRKTQSPKTSPLQTTSIHQHLLTLFSHCNLPQIAFAKELEVCKTKGLTDQESVIELIKKYDDPHLDPSIRKKLFAFATPSGLRYSSLLKTQTLSETLHDLTQSHPTAVRITKGDQTRYLRPEHVTFGPQGFFNQEGEIRSLFGAEALHRVSSLSSGSRGLHFKQYPTHPMMEYAIHSLTSRIAGNCTPATELVRFDVHQGEKIRTYPVLLSQTIQGETLNKIKTPLDWQSLSPEAKKQWTWTLLCALLTKPGDGKFNNYILSQDKEVFCIDNDISFAELNLSSLFSSRQFSFCSAPFLALENATLDEEVLNEFIKLDSTQILKGWIDDLIVQEQKYRSLFTLDERAKFHKEDPTNQFRANLLFREATLTTLQSQWIKIQISMIRALKEKKPVTPLALLKELIGFQQGHPGDIGIQVHHRYQEALKRSLPERMEIAAARNTRASLTARDAEKSYLGRALTFHDIEHWTYPIEKVKKELEAFFYKEFGALSLTSTQGETTVRGDFEKLPEELHEILLKQCAFDPSTRDNRPLSIAIRHCKALRSETLKPLLHSKLKSLDISHCPNIQDEDMELIQKECPHLEKLHISHCDGLKNFALKRFGRDSVPLAFPSLSSLTISHCPQLTTFKVNCDQPIEEGGRRALLQAPLLSPLLAPSLSRLTVSYCPQLTTLKANARYLSKLVISNNPALVDVESGATEMDVRGSPRAIPVITPDLASGGPSMIPVLNRRFGRPESAFGAIAWRFFFGDIGMEPPLPPDIEEILKSPCPIFPGKRIEETHTLALVPATVNGKPLTLDSLGELIKHPKNGGKVTNYRFYSEFIKKEIGQLPAPASHWVLMTTDVLPNTRKKTYGDLLSEVYKYTGYEVPKALEAAVAILTGYVKTGLRWFSDSPYTYTRCQEEVEGCQVTLGGLGSSGLNIGTYSVVGFENCGVGALRKFRS